jgi:ABC-type nickel/cobalt efflux system permease component RcnA
MIKLLSYTLITVIGAGLLIKAVFLRSSPSGNNTKSARAAGILPLVFSIGIIPCPGVAILLIFAASLHFLRLGIFLALVMALGMACTVSAVAFATITARKRLGFFAEDGEKKRKAEKFMELTGALLIFALGLFFLIGNL